MTVVVGEQAHSTLRKSLGFVGLGRRRVVVVPADEQGRLRADRLPSDVDGPVLVCAQAGEVNTGAFDPFDSIADWAAEHDGWLHVDGAFGLWALADTTRRGLVGGLDRADSWATDGHKWLNVTYDCGITFVRRAEDPRRSFRATAGYLPTGDELRGDAPHAAVVTARPPDRGVGGAALARSGRPRPSGRERCVTPPPSSPSDCAPRAPTIVNDVVLNQVLVRFADAATTTAVLAAVARRRPGVVRADGVARRAGDAHQRVVVAHHPDDARRAADVIIELADLVTHVSISDCEYGAGLGDRRGLVSVTTA